MISVILVILDEGCHTRSLHGWMKKVHLDSHYGRLCSVTCLRLPCLLELALSALLGLQLFLIKWQPLAPLTLVHIMNSQICLALCPQKAFSYCFTLKLIAINEKAENSMAKVGEIF
jgi:hypothetical protein